MKLEFESDVFGIEKDKSFESVIAQISKGFGEQGNSRRMLSFIP